MVLTLEYLLEVSQAFFALALAPLVVGFVRWLKARMQNRRGAPPWQPYFELRQAVRQRSGRVPASLVAVSLRALHRFCQHPCGDVPCAVFLCTGAPDGVGDLLAVVYLLLLGTFFLALAGLDPGTAFGGMGSSREMTVAAIAEPTIALAIFSLALGAGSTNLGRIVTQALGNPATAISPGHLLAFAALFIVTLAETGRLPVDNPATHLELTMIHEAMILEYSGRYLALIEWAASLKLMIFFSLLANLFVPWGVATDIAPVALAVAVMALLLKLGLLSLLSR